MNKDLTEIGIVLDKSGSMGGIRKDTIGGFNTFIEDQKKEPGQANVSLINFSDELKKIYRCENIQKVATLTTKNYVPGGLTALYDGFGTMNLHKGSGLCEEMMFYTNVENLIDIAPIFFTKRLIAPIYFLLRLFISHIALKNNKNEK